MPRAFYAGVLPFIFLFSFSVYLATLNPSFQPDDSAETAAACATLTPQHPSGYCLYTLLGSLAIHIPLGSPVFRLNVMAAFFGAWGTVLIGLYLYQKMRAFGTNDRSGAILAALAGAFALAFSKTYWAQSVTAKGGIYILQSFVFLGGVLCVEILSELAGRKKRPGIALLLGLILGSGAANGLEMTVVYVFVGGIYFALNGSFQKKRFVSGAKELIRSLSLFMVGASLYLSLPLRPGQILVWGDTKHWREFLQFLFFVDKRSEMGLKLFKDLAQFSTNSQDWNEAWQQILGLGPQFDRVSRHLIFDLSAWAWIPILWGLFFFYQKGKTTWLFLGSMTVLLLALMSGFLFYFEPENLWCLDKFLVPANVFLAIALGVGLGSWSISQRKVWRWIGLGTALFIPFWSLSENYGTNDRSGQTAAYEDGSDLMRSLKRSAIFFAEGDNNIFPVSYFQAALHRRQDVTLVPADYLWTDWGTPALKEKLGPLSPDLSGRGFSSRGEKVFNEMQDIRHQNGGQRPLQFSSYLDLLDRCFFSHQPKVEKTGDLFQLLTPYGATLMLSPKEEGLGILDQFRVRPARGNVENEGGMAILFDSQAQAFFNAAEYCSRSGQGPRADGYYPKALDQAVDPKLISRIWEGWGDSLMGRGMRKEAEVAYQHSIGSDPEAPNCAKLVRFYFNSGDYSRALDCALRTLALFPESPLAQRDVMICRTALERSTRLAPKAP